MLYFYKEEEVSELARHGGALAQGWLALARHGGPLAQEEPVFERHPRPLAQQTHSLAQQTLPLKKITPPPHKSSHKTSPLLHFDMPYNQKGALRHFVHLGNLPYLESIRQLSFQRSAHGHHRPHCAVPGYRL